MSECVCRACLCGLHGILCLCAHRPLVKGAIGGFILSTSLIGGAFIGLGVTLPFIFLLPIAYYFGVGAIQSAWGWFLCGVAERYYGVKFFLSGDSLPSTPGRVLLISNHRTRVDWLFLWPLALLANTASGLRIILKAGLKHVPFFGWALQQFDCCFLERKLDVDEAHMKAMMGRYIARQEPYMMLLFPEGTDLSPSNTQLADEFSEKMGLPKLRFTLHPRTKGWWICLNSLRGHVDEVWDVTLGYQGRIAQNEAAMLSARTPSEAHVLLKRYKVSDIPQESEAAAASWLKARFAEKEAALHSFYANGKFPGSTHVPLSPVKCFSAIAFFEALFVLVVVGLVNHPLPVGFALASYFTFFFMMKKFFGGLDKFLLEKKV